MAGFDLFPVATGDYLHGTRWTNWKLWNQIENALEEKVKPFNCDNEWPPPAPLWGSGTITSVDDFSGSTPPYLVFHMTNVDWHVPSGFSGTRWVDYESADPTLCYIVSNYDLVTISDFNDSLTWVRSTITANTYTPGSPGTGTITVSSKPFTNAVTAGYIPSIASLAGKIYRFYKQDTGYTSRDRRLTQPNKQELWKGTVLTGWVSATNNGYIEQVTSDFNSDPYNKDTNDVVSWAIDQYAGKQCLMFDEDGLLRRVTIAHNDATHWFFGTTTLATIAKPVGAKDISGTFLAITSGDKGMPDRAHDAPHVWYTGAMTGYISHYPNDTRASVQKPVPNVDWQDLNSDNECVEFPHSCFDVDCQIEINNQCECARAGDFITRGFWDSPRAKQIAALGLLTSYVDIFNTFGDGGVLRLFTPATWALGYQTANSVPLNAWASSISYSGSSTSVAIGTHAAPHYPIQVYYTILDVHSGIKKSGIGSLDSSGNLSGGPFDSTDDTLAVNLWFGFSRFYRLKVKNLYPISRWIADSTETGVLDPPAVTPGGTLANPTTGMTASVESSGGTLTYNTTYYYRFTYTNGSGETLASTEISIKASRCTVTCPTPPCPPNSTTTVCDTANTYKITLHWPKISGASGVNIYGRTSGSEQLLGSPSVDDPGFVDDGSITPSGALPVSNTTHNDCFGVGTWLHRDVSNGYMGRSTTGFVGENANGFTVNDLAMFMGDTVFDPFDGRGGVSQTSRPDDFYWDGLYRGTYKKLTQSARRVHQAGSVATGTAYRITDKDASWWTDGVSTGQLRMQGGTASGGSTTTITFSGVTSQKLCWFNASKYLGSLNGVAATPMSFFVIELFTSGLPAGYSVSADGTASWSGPGPEPTPDFKVPIRSFSLASTTGTFTLANNIGTAVASGWGWIVRWPKYELNRHRGRTVTFSKNDGTVLRLICRYSDNDSLYVDTQTFSFDNNWSYSIDELDPHSVVRYSTTVPPITSRYVEIATGKYWVQPVGADMRSGVNVPFLPNMQWNLAQKVTDYGLAMAGDDVGAHILNELYYVIRSMKWTKTTWSNYWPDSSNNVSTGDVASDSGVGGYADPSTFFGYMNLPAGSYSNLNTPPNPLSNGLSPERDVVFAGITVGHVASPSPFAIATATLNKDNIDSADLLLNDSGTSSEVASSKEAAYGQTTKVTCISASVHFLSWGESSGPIDPSSCPGGSTYTNDNAGTTKCVTPGWCNAAASCCPPLGNFIQMDKFDSGGNPVAWHRYTEWNVTGPDTSALVTSTTALGDINGTFLPAVPTFGACDSVTSTLGWVNVKNDAIIHWEGMLYV